VSDDKTVSTPDTSGSTLTKGTTADGEVLLKVTGLQKHFPIRKGLLQRQTGAVRAVDGIDFEVRKGRRSASSVSRAAASPPWAG
jgi:peptide/nickel transport system ATP-binding protein